MISARDWARSYARQAKAEIAAYYHLSSSGTVPTCVRLHCLQMACEKLVKAFLLRSGSRLADVETTHAVVRKTLPRIYIDCNRRIYGTQLSSKSDRLHQVRRFAQEIDALHPSVNREQRPDNCEYPWIDGNHLIVPAPYRFHIEDMLKREGAPFLKFVSAVIDELAA